MSLIPMISQIESEALGSWVQMFFYAAGGAVALLVGAAALIRIFVPTPAPYKAELAAVRDESRANEELIRRDLEDKTSQIHGRISSLRDEISVKLEQASTRMEQAAREMRTASAATDAAVNRLVGTVEQVNQRQTAAENKIDRHIEKTPHP